MGSDEVMKEGEGFSWGPGAKSSDGGRGGMKELGDGLRALSDAHKTDKPQPGEEDPPT